jgi:hypothetical protein
MNEQLFALVEGGHIDDIRSFAFDEAEIFTAVDGGEWVPLSRLQGHPDLLYFGLETLQNVSIAPNMTTVSFASENVA